MDFLQRLTLVNWVCRVTVALVGVTVIRAGYRISKIRDTSRLAGLRSDRDAGRMLDVPGVVGVLFAGLGIAIIIAGLLWPIPLDWARPPYR